MPRTINETTRAKAEKVAKALNANVHDMRYERNCLVVEYERDGKIVKGATPNGFPFDFQVSAAEEAFKEAGE